MRVSKKRRQLEQDLLFYLRYYKKIVPDSRHKFDLLIEELVEKLKQS